jgi:hypothetical protein
MSVLSNDVVRMHVAHEIMLDKVNANTSQTADNTASVNTVDA